MPLTKDELQKNTEKAKQLAIEIGHLTDNADLAHVLLDLALQKAEKNELLLSDERTAKKLKKLITEEINHPNAPLFYKKLDFWVKKIRNEVTDEDRNNLKQHTTYTKQKPSFLESKMRAAGIPVRKVFGKECVDPNDLPKKLRTEKPLILTPIDLNQATNDPAYSTEISKAVDKVREASQARSLTLLIPVNDHYHWRLLTIILEKGKMIKASLWGSSTVNVKNAPITEKVKNAIAEINTKQNSAAVEQKIKDVPPPVQLKIENQKMGSTVDQVVQKALQVKYPATELSAPEANLCAIRDSQTDKSLHENIKKRMFDENPKLQHKKALITEISQVRKQLNSPDAIEQLHRSLKTLSESEKDRHLQIEFDEMLARKASELFALKDHQEEFSKAHRDSPIKITKQELELEKTIFAEARKKAREAFLTKYGFFVADKAEANAEARQVLRRKSR